MRSAGGQLFEILPEVRDCLRRDGWAIAPVAGALVILPLLLLFRVLGIDVLDPSRTPKEPGLAANLLLLVVVGLNQLAQLFVTALAVGSGGATVGALLLRGLRLLPRALAIGLLQALVMSPGLSLMVAPDPGVAFLGAFALGVGIYLFVRLILAVPALVRETLGVRAAVARSWELTRGRTLALLALLGALLVGFFLLAVVLLALAAPVAAIATLLLGDAGPGWGPGQWINVLALAALQAMLSVLVALVAGRVYRALAG